MVRRRRSADRRQLRGRTPARLHPQQRSQRRADRPGPPFPHRQRPRRMGGGGGEGVRLLHRAVRYWWRTAVLLLLGLAVVQWVVASRVPLDPDESYYWEWSRRL